MNVEHCGVGCTTEGAKGWLVPLGIGAAVGAMLMWYRAKSSATPNPYISDVSQVSDWREQHRLEKDVRFSELDHYMEALRPPKSKYNYLNKRSRGWIWDNAMRTLEAYIDETQDFETAFCYLKELASLAHTDPELQGRPFARSLFKKMHPWMKSHRLVVK